MAAVDVLLKLVNLLPCVQNCQNGDISKRALAHTMLCTSCSPLHAANPPPTLTMVPYVDNGSFRILLIQLLISRARGHLPGPQRAMVMSSDSAPRYHASQSAVKAAGLCFDSWVIAPCTIPKKPSSRPFNASTAAVNDPSQNHHRRTIFCGSNSVRLSALPAAPCAKLASAPAPTAAPPPANEVAAPALLALSAAASSTPSMTRSHAESWRRATAPDIIIAASPRAL